MPGTTVQMEAGLESESFFDGEKQGKENAQGFDGEGVRGFFLQPRFRLSSLEGRQNSLGSPCSILRDRNGMDLTEAEDTKKR